MADQTPANGKRNLLTNTSVNTCNACACTHQFSGLNGPVDGEKAIRGKINHTGACLPDLSGVMQNFIHKILHLAKFGK